MIDVVDAVTVSIRRGSMGGTWLRQAVFVEVNDSDRNSCCEAGGRSSGDRGSRGM